MGSDFLKLFAGLCVLAALTACKRAPSAAGGGTGTLTLTSHYWLYASDKLQVARIQNAQGEVVIPYLIDPEVSKATISQQPTVEKVWKDGNDVMVVKILFQNASIPSTGRQEWVLVPNAERGKMFFYTLEDCLQYGKEQKLIDPLETLDWFTLMYKR